MYMRFSAPWFGRVLSALLLAASKDETRAHLFGILIDVTDGVMVATDGHVLAVHAIDRSDVDLASDYSAPDPILLSRPDAERIAKLIGKARAGDVTFEPQGKGAFRVTHIGTTMLVQAVDATFPPWRQAMPVESREATIAHGIGVNHAYIAAAGKSFDLASGGLRGAIVLQPGALHDPIRVTSDEYRALTWIVMPVSRGKAAEAVPYKAPTYAESEADRAARVRREHEAALALAQSFALPDAAE
jgi:DNA polymerase III beta subunit, central domain